MTTIKLKLLKWELAAVFFIFLFSRLPFLGFDTFNTDVWKWKSRIYDFGTGVFTLNFEKTIQKYHPGVTLMWLGSGAVKVYNLYYETIRKVLPPDNDVQTIFELNFVQKLFIVAFLGLVLASIYYVLGNMFGRRYAVIVFVLIVFDPFYTALSREIHLEGLLSILMLGSFLWFYYYLENTKDSSRFIISGIFGALAVLTKTTAAFIVPFSFILAYLFYYIQNKKVHDSLKLALTPYYKWLMVFTVCFILFWPAMWVMPEQALQSLVKGVFDVGIEEGHEQLYFGRLVEDPGLAYYLVVFAFRSSVLLVIGLLGFVLFSRKSYNSETKKFILISLLYSVLYLVEITLPSKKLDRYILPGMLGLMLSAGFFYDWLLGKLKSFHNIAFLWVFLPSLILFIQLVPDYFSYYNPILGGLAKGIFVLEPKWMIGQRQIQNYFISLKEKEKLVDFRNNESLDSAINKPEINTKLTIGFQEKYYTQIHPFISRIGGRAVIQDLTPHAVRTKYFVYPVWDDRSKEENRFKLKYVDSIFLRSVEVYRVYARQ